MPHIVPTFDSNYKIVQLTARHDDQLNVFMDKCHDVGIHNNSSRKAMKYDDPSSQYWGIIYEPEDSIIGVCGMHHFPLDLPAWGGLIEKCWRVGLRQATLPEHRARFSSGLGSNLERSFGFGGIFPMQIKMALDLGAEKIICTTNSSMNSVDHTGKLFQMDRIAGYLARKGYATHVGKDVMIYGAYQNVWDLNPEAWGVT